MFPQGQIRSPTQLHLLVVGVAVATQVVLLMDPMLAVVVEEAAVVQTVMLALREPQTKVMRVALVIQTKFKILPLAVAEVLAVSEATTAAEMRVLAETVFLVPLPPAR